MCGESIMERSCSVALYSIRFAIPHQPIRGSLDCLIVESLDRSVAGSGAELRLPKASSVEAAVVIMVERKLRSGGPKLFPDLYFGGIQIATYIRGAAILYKHSGLCQIDCVWWLLAQRFRRI